MKKEVSDSEVNQLLSFDTEHIVELKRFSENNFRLPQVLVAL